MKQVICFLCATRAGASLLIMMRKVIVMKPAHALALFATPSQPSNNPSLQSKEKANENSPSKSKTAD